MSVRHNAGVVLVAVLVATAGCSYLSGPLTFEANEATVGDGALGETGYEEVAVEDVTVNRTFSAAGQSKQVTVTNWLAQYERRVDLGPLGSQRAAVFVAFATPQVEVAGQAFNPVGDLSEKELLKRFQSRYQSISVGDQVGSTEVSTLGTTVDLKKFDGQATFRGQQIDVYLHVAKFEHGDDYVVALAVYPQRLSGEESKVVRLTEGLDHDSGDS
jgi:hypothetical protein